MKIALAAPRWKNGNSYPPLGLAYLAASVQRAFPKAEVKIFDFNLQMKSTTMSNAEEALAFKPDLIGITCMTNVYKEALELARSIKKRAEVKIVFGGPHPSVFPVETLKNDCVDYVIAGEGESSFCELINALDNDENDFSHIKGLHYKSGGEVVSNDPCALVADLDDLPFPARGLLTLDDYPLKTSDGKVIATVMTSRGCPFHCTYCFKGLFGKSYRQRSAESIVAEVEDVITNFGVRDIYFIDDIFMLNLERVRKICELIIKKKLGIRFQCLARVDRISEKLLDLLTRAGCVEIHYGIESGNQEVLNRIKKGISLKQVKKAVKLTKRAGIRVKGYFMTGLPGETLETVRQTIDFADSLDCDDTMFSMTTPFPGTDLFEALKAKHPGMRFDDKFVDAYYFCGDDAMIPTFFNLSNIPSDELVEITRKANSDMIVKKRRDRYKKKFGNVVGVFFFGLSKISPLLKMGEYVNNRFLNQR